MNKFILTFVSCSGCVRRNTFLWKQRSKSVYIMCRDSQHCQYVQHPLVSYISKYPPGEKRINERLPNDILFN